MQLKKAVNYLTEKFRKGVEYGPNIAAWCGGSGILCGRFPGYGPPSLFVSYSYPYKRLLVGSATLEAIPAINWLAAVGLKGNLRIHTATGTHGIIHGSLRAIVTASAITAPVAAATITPITVLFGSIPAGLALSGWLEAFGFIKITLFLAKGKVDAACSTSNIGCLH
jgi:hypothetical protein